MGRCIIAVTDVLEAAQKGTKTIVAHPAECIVTPGARDKAAELGIVISEGSDSPAVMPVRTSQSDPVQAEKLVRAVCALMQERLPAGTAPQDLERLVRSAVAARLGIGMHVHLSETPGEVDSALTEYGMTPVEVLDKNGVFDVSVTAVHAIHLTHVDIDLLAERSACAVYGPPAHTIRGLGQTPVQLLQAAGIPVGIGTEGAESSYSLSMLQTVSFKPKRLSVSTR